MKRKIISGLMTLIFVINMYGYKVEAINNNSEAKSKIMSNYQNNKEKKNYKEDEIIVKVKAGTTNSIMEATDKKYSIKAKKHLNQQLDVVNFDNTKYSMDEMLLNLNSDLNIEYAEPNYINKLSSVPEDEPGLNLMWGLNNNTSPGIDINVKPAWKVNAGNPNIVVGVIDTGIDYNHEDLKDNLWINSGETPNNGIDDDNNGYVDDYNGWNFVYDYNNTYDDHSHGTHVSGTIAAAANGIGAVGVAPNVKIMPLKAANSQGTSYTSDVISAIEYGVSKGVKLFNCSFGGTGFSQSEYDAMKNSNALFMCAAGNGDAYGIGLDNDSYVKNYPASFDLDNVISVASIDKYGQLSTFSNYGTVSVDIAAPGSVIYSTIPNGYGYKSGTSMATPYVTGVAALVLSANLGLSTAEVKGCIFQGDHKLPQLETKISTGAIVDAFGAVGLAKPSIVVKVAGLQLDSSSMTLSSGLSKQLTPTITPSDATNKLINWTSSDLNVVTVNSSGKVNAIKEGTAVVTAITVDGNKTSTCMVTVTKPLTSKYYPGDKFTLRINTPSILGDSGLAYMIKPDGTEESYWLQCNITEGYYYIDLSVDNDGYIFYNEIDPIKDFGTWEVKYVAINNNNYSYNYYYNEKYYSVDSENKKTLNFNNSKFTIVGADGIIKDDTNDLSNNSKMPTPGDITLFKSVEVTRNKAYPGDKIIVKVKAQDSSGIGSGLIYFTKPDGTEKSYSLSTSPRGGYYYTEIEINNGGYVYSTQIDPVKDYGDWKVKKIAFWDIDYNFTYYNYGYSYSYTANLDAGNFTVYNSIKPIIPTDVDDNGSTDVKDLALVGTAYNSNASDSKYKSVLDINKDSIVDIYDLVRVAKAIQ